MAADIAETSSDATHLAPANSRLGFVVLLLLCVITWALSHSYRGIFHDANLYVLQALAHLRPESLSRDVFLEFGSQDRFTIFSSLFATACRLLGTETAASSLTLAFQIALFAGAWALARTVMPAPLALLGVSVLIAIPGDYGPDRIFTCVEQFLTPRMAAEALVLASLAAALRTRTRLAAALVAAAVLIHPIMAAAGIAVMASLYLVIPHPRLSLKLLIPALGTLAVASFVLPTGVWGRFDDAWLALVTHRSPYLFLSHWQLDDWSRAGVTLATLIVGACTLPSGRGRTLCQVAGMTTVGGWVLTLVACDLLHLVLFTQLQPWRWQWLGTVTAAVMLPEILRARWQAGTGGRTMAVLLLAAWIFGVNEFAVVASLAAVASIGGLRRCSPRESSLLFWGACGMLGIAVVWRVASNLEFTEAYYLDAHIPLWLRRIMSFTHDGFGPMAVIALAWWLAHEVRGRIGLTLMAVLAAAACVALLPQTWMRWTAREFPPHLAAQFAPWRETIPPAAEVLWAESPLASWVLLGRPSFISGIQTSGLVFSRDAAMELKRRADTLSSVVPPQSFLEWAGVGPALPLSVQQLQGICRLGAFDFLVTSADLGIAPVASLPRETWTLSHGLWLYRCATRL